MKSKETVVAAAVGVVVIILMIVGLILPKARAVTARQREVVEAQQVESQLQLQLTELRAAEHDAPSNRRRLSALLAQVPPTPDLPGLIRQLNGVADQSDVDFMTISPQEPQPTPGSDVAVISVQINVTGSFWAVDQYLFELETMPRLAKVTQISVTGSTGSQSSSSASPTSLSATGKLQVSLTALFFTTASSTGASPVTPKTSPTGQPPTPASPRPSTAPVSLGPLPTAGG